MTFTPKFDQLVLDFGFARFRINAILLTRVIKALIIATASHTDLAQTKNV